MSPVGRSLGESSSIISINSHTLNAHLILFSSWLCPTNLKSALYLFLFLCLSLFPFEHTIERAIRWSNLGGFHFSTGFYFIFILFCWSLVWSTQLIFARVMYCGSLMAGRSIGLPSHQCGQKWLTNREKGHLEVKERRPSRIWSYEFKK